MINFLEINKKAIEALNGNGDDGYKLFKKNMEENPNYITYNNFVVYLAYHNTTTLWEVGPNCDIDYYKRYLDKAIEFKPNSKSYYALAYIYYDTKEFDNAINYYIKGIELDDNLITKNIALFNLTLSYAHENIEDYEQAYLTVRSIDTNNLLEKENFSRFLYLYSYILYKLNKKDELEHLLKKYYKEVYGNWEYECYDWILEVAYILDKYDIILELDYKKLDNYEFNYYYIIFNTYYKHKKSKFKEVVKYFNNEARKNKYYANDESKKKIIKRCLKTISNKKTIDIKFYPISPYKMFLCLYHGCTCSDENNN